MNGIPLSACVHTLHGIQTVRATNTFEAQLLTTRVESSDEPSNGEFNSVQRLAAMFALVLYFQSLYFFRLFFFPPFGISLEAIVAVVYTKQQQQQQQRQHNT